MIKGSIKFIGVIVKINKKSKFKKFIGDLILNRKVKINCSCGGLVSILFCDQTTCVIGILSSFHIYKHV